MCLPNFLLKCIKDLIVSQIFFQFFLLFSDRPDISESLVVILWMCCSANSVGDMSFSLSCTSRLWELQEDLPSELKMEEEEVQEETATGAGSVSGGDQRQEVHQVRQGGSVL